jgi:hypothetical protein
MIGCFVMLRSEWVIRGVREGEWVFEVMRVRGGYKGGERVNGAF